MSLFSPITFGNVTFDRNDADVIIMAREFLRDPYFPRRAAKELSVEIAPPIQYGRAW